ncbi:hypothetical protein SO802_032773 [Lithocarpus litseifolius]|uniref:Uncharacterized protein n=1 Tax=Lithocarpus litseifolius TaxID=425828 RepID=A0AAW2BCR2_9ROSI
MTGNRNKGKAPIQDYFQNKRLTKQSFVMHEGASSKGNQREATSLQGSVPEETDSSSNMVTVLHETLCKESHGVYLNFPYSTRTILDLLHSAYILHNTKLFQRTLKTLKNHLVNLKAKNDHITSLLSGKEEIRSKDKIVLMGTDFARLSLMTQASVRSAFANLPSEIQVCILGSKAMTKSLDQWFRQFRILVTTKHPDLDDSDHVNDALSLARWEAYFGSSLRVYERAKHPFPGLLISFSDVSEDEEEDNQMNPHWLSQMFEYGFVRNPQALAECWRNNFNNEILNVTKELWKNYHFIGNTGRVSVFSTRPYFESTPQLSWVHNCDPRRFMIPGTDPIFEPLIYCGLCEQFTTFHEHPCNDDPPWESPDDDFDGSFNWQPPILLRDRPTSQASFSRPLAPYPRSRRDLGVELQGVKTKSQQSTTLCYHPLNKVLQAQNQKLPLAAVNDTMLSSVE